MSESGYILIIFRMVKVHTRDLRVRQPESYENKKEKDRSLVFQLHDNEYWQAVFGIGSL